MLDREELAAAFTKRTKMIVMTTPNNPLGKVVQTDVYCTCIRICLLDSITEQALVQIRIYTAWLHFFFYASVLNVLLF